MVDLLARRCWEQHGLVPLVLSRGYHGADEARMLAHRLADTPAVIAAGPDRASLAAQVRPATAPPKPSLVSEVFTLRTLRPRNRC